MKRRTKKGGKQSDRGKASQTLKKGPLHERKKKFFNCKNGLLKRCAIVLLWNILAKDVQ